MRKFLVATAAAAALMAGTPALFAQGVEQEGNWYVIDGQGGSKIVIGPASPDGTELQMSQDGNAPSNCPAGSFWQNSEGTIVACDDATAMFNTRAPEQGEMMTNTEPYPEKAMLLVPQETGGSKSDQDTNSGGQGNSSSN